VLRVRSSSHKAERRLQPSSLARSHDAQRCTTELGYGCVRHDARYRPLLSITNPRGVLIGVCLKRKRLPSPPRCLPPPTLVAATMHNARRPCPDLHTWRKDGLSRGSVLEYRMPLVISL
jgi:hypothetical protein